MDFNEVYLKANKQIGRCAVIACKSGLPPDWILHAKIPDTAVSTFADRRVCARCKEDPNHLEVFSAIIKNTILDFVKDPAIVAKVQIVWIPYHNSAAHSVRRTEAARWN